MNQTVKIHNKRCNIINKIILEGKKKEQEIESDLDWWRTLKNGFIFDRRTGRLKDTACRRITTANLPRGMDTG